MVPNQTGRVAISFPTPAPDLEGIPAAGAPGPGDPDADRPRDRLARFLLDRTHGMGTWAHGHGDGPRGPAPNALTVQISSNPNPPSPQAFVRSSSLGRRREPSGTSLDGHDPQAMGLWSKGSENTALKTVQASLPKNTPRPPHRGRDLERDLDRDFERRRRRRRDDDGSTPWRGGARNGRGSGATPPPQMTVVAGSNPRKKGSLQGDRTHVKQCPNRTPCLRAPKNATHSPGWIFVEEGITGGITKQNIHEIRTEQKF